MPSWLKWLPVVFMVCTSVFFLYLAFNPDSYDYGSVFLMAMAGGFGLGAIAIALEIRRKKIQEIGDIFR